MRIDVDEELSKEPKPDTSFLRPRLTKKREELETPFQGEPKAEGVVSSSVNKPKLKPKQNSEIKKKDHSEASSSPRKSDPICKTEREIEIIKQHGHISCLYYILLEKNSENGVICRSHTELAHILAVEKSSVRRIIGDLEAKSLLRRIKASDPKSKTPNSYKLLET